MARTYEDYIALATAAHARGFTSEAARKDALDFLNRAFDAAMAEIAKALLADGVDRETPEHKAMYWGRPSCHHWRADKHPALFAQFPLQVEQANRASELRAAIKATALVAKPPRKPTKKELEKLAHARTCQICGRAIFAEVGVIAHHGYERPGQGWQTSSCPGARHVPFEVSRDILVDHIKRCEEQLETMKTSCDAVAGEASPVVVYYELDRKDENGRAIYDNRTGARITDAFLFSATRETMAAIQIEHAAYFRKAFRSHNMPADVFQHLLNADIKQRQAEIAAHADYINHQRARATAWKAAERWDAAASTWVKL